MAQVGKPRNVDFGVQFSSDEGREDADLSHSIDAATIPSWLYSADPLPWEATVVKDAFSGKVKSASGRAGGKQPTLDEVAARFTVAAAD